MTRIGGTTCGGRYGFRRACCAFKNEGKDGERANGEGEGGSGARATPNDKERGKGDRGSGGGNMGAACGSTAVEKGEREGAVWRGRRN